jgi:NAD-dependent dihydropyrimidine dehydrogenase PreA subunit/DNA-binding HxlR family transcriptional regulator
MSEKVWNKVARTFQKAGGFPFPINGTVIELIQTLITQKEAEFINGIFKKPNLNFDQIKAKNDIDDDSLNKMLEVLMNKGIIFGSISKTTGTKVYTLMPLLPGVFEYSFMKGETGEKQKKLAHLYNMLFEEMTENVQNNYDNFVAQLQAAPFMDRVVPVGEQIDVQPEMVLPFEEIQKLIENSDTIAVSNCYCRHHKDVLGEHCKIDAPKLNCIQLGKNASFAIEHGFAKSLSKEEAMTILREAEDAGLVHKAIHASLNPEKIEVAICNCCKCCCETFQSYYQGWGAIKSLTSYLAKVNEDACVGCGTCVNICPVEAPELIDTIAIINENRCIGCGVCAHHCPEEAISLERTGPRQVFVPPPRLKQN